MDIACGIDNKYTEHCGVLMISVFENNKDKEICFHILSSDLNSSNKKKLTDIANRYNCYIEFYHVDQSLLKDCPIQESDYLTIATYNRLIIPWLLPKNIDKVLYLDCDIVVCGSLCELWDFDITSSAVGAVYDKRFANIQNYNRLDYDYSLRYFNAGVLLMNLSYWRENKIAEEIFKYISQNSKYLKFHDQDALNYVLRERKISLPMQYNVQSDFFLEEPPFAPKEFWIDMHSAARNPIILHFTDPVKPWNYGCQHPKKSEYHKYKFLSTWANKSLSLLSYKWLVKTVLLKFAVLIKLKNRAYNKMIVF